MSKCPTHDYKLNQDVMYLDCVSKKWFAATIVHLMGGISYLIKTPEGVEYRKTTASQTVQMKKSLCATKGHKG